MTQFAKQYTAAKRKGEVKVLTPQLFKFEKKGQRLIGAFVSKTHIDTEGDGQGYNQYVFMTDDGLVKCGPGRSFDADVGAILAEGMVYAVEFLGQAQTNKGFRVNKFNVEEVGRATYEEEAPAESPESGEADNAE